jgi:hypothetical protein
VHIDRHILLECFSFNLTSSFSVAVTLRLIIRDQSGGELYRADLPVSASYSGLITWSAINMDVAAGTTLIFTAYLADGQTIQSRGGIYYSNADVDGVAGSTAYRYFASEISSDAALET